MREKAEAVKPTEIEEPAREGASLIELREGWCKFPLYGAFDTIYRFCGARTGGHVYCQHHRRIAYSTDK